MTLSVAGIYGVVSFTVTQKTRELGIRLALGAQTADIFREVLLSGARPVLLGLFLGLWLALAADSAIRNIFAQFSPGTGCRQPRRLSRLRAVAGRGGAGRHVFPRTPWRRSDPTKALRYE